MDRFGDAGALGGLAAGAPDHFRGDRTIRGVPAISWKQPDLRPAPHSPPVGAKFLKQLGTEHDIAVFASLAALNVDHHPLAVDIGDFQLGQLGAAQSGGIRRHEQHAVERSLRRADQLRHFRLAEDQGQMQRLLGVGGIGDAPGFAQCLDEEESESRQAHDDGIRCQFALGEQLGLILAHVFGTQPVGWPVEVTGEILNGADVRPRCTLREVKTLEFLEHYFA